MKNIIFLDIDGVFNFELYYQSEEFKSYLPMMNELLSTSKENFLKYYSSQICKDTINIFNNLCEETDSQVVISSTWRIGKTIEELQEMFDYCGGTFKIIGKTGSCECRTRGCEIKKWLHDYTFKYFQVEYYDFYRYAIIDDDSDMLLNQQYNFFQVDNYVGLTPTLSNEIRNFLIHKTF